MSSPLTFTPRVQPLSALDGMWAGQDVKVFELRLQREASDTAISIWASGRTKLLEPLPKPEKKGTGAEADAEDNADDGEEEEDEDEEEIAAAVDIGSDVSSHVSVDSRVEKPAPSGDSSDASGDISASSSTSDSTLKKPKPKPAPVPGDGGIVKPADGGAVGKISRTGKIAPWWDFTYYYIADNRHTKEQDCKILIKHEFTTDACFGNSDKSKTRTPRHFGESHDNPVRTMLHLRAWAFQRCFSTSFVQKEGSRRRDFGSDEARLEREVANLHAKDKLLGDESASDQFAAGLPAMAARLRAA